MSDEPVDPRTRIRPRREPPPLRLVRVVDRVELNSRMLRLTFEGDELRELVAPEPAASVRLLVPSPGAVGLVLPTWNGNEFLLPEGERPALRTFTPLRFEPDAGRLDLEIVRHPGGAVSDWAESVEREAEAAISGPGRGMELPDGVGHVVLFGDETALPAIGQLLQWLPEAVATEVHLEVDAADAAMGLPERDRCSVEWHVRDAAARPGDSLVTAARAVDAVASDGHVWAAGEAASMQAIRKHFFDTVGLARGHTTVRGYWKPARPHG